MTRSWIPTSVRKRILRRPGGCYYCKRHVRKRKNYKGEITSRGYEIDHLVPVSQGGSDHESNLVKACYSCNRSRNNKPIWKMNDWLPSSGESALRQIMSNSLFH